MKLDYKKLLLDSLKSDYHIEMEGVNFNYANLLNNNREELHSIELYNNDASVEVYKNFLDWLFETFDTNEKAFRKEWLSLLNLKKGYKVLITGCGLGEDAIFCSEAVGLKSGVVHAQDLSSRFVEYASSLVPENVVLTVSDALDLPYKDNYFDAVCHFGGINLFDDIRQGIAEMNRVCRVGGQVLFGDESVAQHLRETEYGKMFIKNNHLWGSDAPINLLPETAESIFLRYVLGNCFYLIGFRKGKTLPNANIDLIHKGYRGGSVRTRYYGELEGVDPESKQKIYNYAKASNKSVVEILESLIEEL
ncbi:class I SAM-dependent methyltransferase [Francisella philomiragia]|uniref:class I SAM-dependent methyltransferase n=1 Tax=Francisella philomiragia TaxID=28110 RepID=UPI003517C563